MGAIFKDEFPFDEAEDDCLDEVADAGDLDEAFNLNDIEDAYQPQADYIRPAFDEQSAEVYEFDEECEEEEVSQADTDDTEEFFDFDNVLGNVEAAFDSQNEIFEEDCV